MNPTPIIEERVGDFDAMHAPSADGHATASPLSTRVGRWFSLPRPSVSYLPQAVYRAEVLAGQCILIADHLAAGEVVVAMMELDEHLDRLHELIDFVVMAGNEAQASQPHAIAPLRRFALDVLEIVDRISDCLDERDLDRVQFAVKRGLASALRRYRPVVREIEALSEACRIQSPAAHMNDWRAYAVRAAAG